MTNTPKGMEVLPENTRDPKALDGAGFMPPGPEWIADSTYHFEYGLCERDGQWFLCTRDCVEKDWKILTEADELILRRAFEQFRENPKGLASFLNWWVLSRLREKGLALWP